MDNEDALALSVGYEGTEAKVVEYGEDAISTDCADWMLDDDGFSSVPAPIVPVKDIPSELSLLFVEVNRLDGPNFDEDN